MRICFLDTETTSLRWNRRPWEIGIIWTDTFGDTFDQDRWFVRKEDLDLKNADVASLEKGGYFERHPDVVGAGSDSLPSVLGAVSEIIHDSVIAGQCPSFDVHTLQYNMRRYGILYSAHYKPVDVTQVAVGYLASTGMPIAPPYDSDMIAHLLGVATPSSMRHTAFGDADMARKVFFKVRELSQSRAVRF